MDNTSQGQPSVTLKSKNNLIGWVMVGVLALLVIGLGIGYLWYNTRADVIFKTKVRSGFENLKQNLEMEQEVITGRMNLTYHIETAAEGMIAPESLSALNKLSLAYDYQLDPKNNLMKIDLHPKFEQEKLMDVQVYFEENKLYVLLKDIYDKYIFINDQTDLKFETSDLKFNQDQLITIVKRLEIAVINALDGLQFNQSKEKIKIEGQTLDVKRVYVTLKSSEYQTLIKTIYQTLKDDSKLKKALEPKLYNSLLEELDQVDSYLAGEKLVIELYTKGFNRDLVKIGLGSEDKAGKQQLITLTKINDSQFNYEFYDNTQKIIDGSIKIANAKNTTPEKVNLEFKLEVYDQIKLTVNLDQEIDHNVEFKKIKIVNPVRLDEITEDEEQEIITKLTANSILQKLIKSFSNQPNLQQ